MCNGRTSSRVWGECGKMSNLDMRQWIAIVRFDKATDQLRMERSNQQFRLSCGISDDCSFRSFARSLRIKPRQKNEKFRSFTFLASRNEQVPRQRMFRKARLMQLPTLEDKLREVLNSEQRQTANSKWDLDSFQKRRISSIYFNQQEFHGIKFHNAIEVTNKYLSVQLIPGYDEFPFVVVFIDEETDKNQIYELQTKVAAFETLIGQKLQQLMQPLTDSFLLVGRLAA